MYINRRKILNAIFIVYLLLVQIPNNCDGTIDLIVNSHKAATSNGRVKNKIEILSCLINAVFYYDRNITFEYFCDQLMCHFIINLKLETSILLHISRHFKPYILTRIFHILEAGI